MDQEQNLRRVTSLMGAKQSKEKKFWNQQGNRRLSVHSMLAPVRLKEPADDGMCRLTLNPHPLRDVSMLYPDLGFRKPGVRATSRSAFTKFYESEVLRPMRSTVRYDRASAALDGLVTASRACSHYESARGEDLAEGTSLFAPK